MLADSKAVLVQRDSMRCFRMLNGMGWGMGDGGGGERERE